MPGPLKHQWLCVCEPLHEPSNRGRNPDSVEAPQRQNGERAKCVRASEGRAPASRDPRSALSELSDAGAFQ